MNFGLFWVVTGFSQPLLPPLPISGRSGQSGHRFPFELNGPSRQGRRTQPCEGNPIVRHRGVGTAGAAAGATVGGFSILRGDRCRTLRGTPRGGRTARWMRTAGVRGLGWLREQQNDAVGVAAWAGEVALLLYDAAETTGWSIPPGHWWRTFVLRCIARGCPVLSSFVCSRRPSSLCSS